MSEQNIHNSFIDRVGLAVIAFVSLGYVLFGSSFAQWRLEFSFLNFPIFIGEILLGTTTLLFIVKWAQQKREVGICGVILGAYLLFVLFKAFYGYYVWGPLALRDAALFYYPLFIVLGYSFWSHDLWKDNVRRGAIVLILIVFILHQFVLYWPCTLIILGVMLALQAKGVKERVILIVAIIIFMPYGDICGVFNRTVFLSTMITGLYLFVVFFLIFLKDRWVRIAGMVLGVFILATVLYAVNETGVWNTYSLKDAKPLALVTQEIHRGNYLYHPVGSSPDKPDVIKKFIHKITKFFLKQENKSTAVSNSCPVTTSSIGVNSSIGEACHTENIRGALRTKKDDTLFRYYIWRDMAHEYVSYKPLFGFDFGRPLRSLTLKKYGLSGTEDNDGWIGAHNSFFYMVYKAGIIGLIMVLSFIFVWIGLFRDFYAIKDLTGILLCAILLNWFISANFFLIFELPYTAIPVWTIFGITLKHRMLIKKMSIAPMSIL